MNTTFAITIDQILHRLPRQGVQRDVALQRLTDMYAAGEALDALRAAAASARESRDTANPETEVIAEVLTAASELWDGNGVPVHVDGEDGGGLRERLVRAVTSAAFRPVLSRWISELRRVANAHPASGACTLATAMQLWTWTLNHFRKTSPASDAAFLELAEAFCWLAAARAQILDAVDEHRGFHAAHRAFLSDLCHVQAARSAGAVATTCAELVFGYRRHPAWDVEGCAHCYSAADLDELEGLIPGIASTARAHDDVVESDGSHAPKAGPCAKRDGVESFIQLRAKLDGCLTGARLTKERAAAALPRVLAATVPAVTH